MADRDELLTKLYELMEEGRRLKREYDEIAEKFYRIKKLLEKDRNSSPRPETLE